MKTIVAALAGVSLLSAAVPAAAQSHHGGWSHGGGSASAGIGFGHGGFGHTGSVASAGSWRHHGFTPGVGGMRPGFTPGHFHHFHGGRAFPFFGLGLAVGLSAFYDPWFYGFYDGPYPYYGYYAPYPPPPPAGYGAPPPIEAPPPGAETAPPPAACGSWSWDPAKQAYNWIPCTAPTAPAN